MLAPDSSSFPSNKEPPARRSAASEPPTEPAYILGRNVPATLMRQMEIVFDTLDSAIFVFDKENIIRRTNAYARAMLGFEPLGLSIDEFFSRLQIATPDGQPVTRENCPTSRAARGETVSHLPLEVHLPDGRTYSILASAIPVQVESTYTGMVSVWSDVTELERLQIERRLLESREQERQEIARELHDGPIQILSGTLFNVQIGKETVEDPRIKAEYEAIAASVKSAVQELRALVNELRPPATIRFGLARAIRAHAADFSEKHPNLALALELAEDENRLPEQANLNLFRIYQEALNNIARHAQAANAWVYFSLENHQAILEIRDDGRGFTVPASLVDRNKSGHFGLLGMSERADTIGGSLSITSQPGQGTRVRVAVPL